jgi:hypothetical protein
MRFIFYICLIFNFLISESFRSNEESVFEKIEINNTKLNKRSNINFIREKNNILNSSINTNKKEIDNLFKEFNFIHKKPRKNIGKAIYLKYIDYPNKVLKNEKFKITIKGTITNNIYDNIETRFINKRDVNILNPFKQWKYINNSLENEYIFKIKSKNFVMPSIQVLFYKNNIVVDVFKLSPLKLEYNEIGNNNLYFSGVIANNLELVTHKTKQYSNNNLMTILELKGINSNLEDFRLEGIENQGFSSIENDILNQTVIYYALIPLHTSEIRFEYYNSLKNSMIKFSSDIILEEDIISTQVDLDPNKSKLLVYEHLFFIFIILLFIILYIVYRKYLFLLGFFISLILYIFYNLPNKFILIKENTPIYILPTQKSTIFYRTKSLKNVELVINKRGYSKIIFKKSNSTNKLVGWVKDIDVIKN